MTSPTETEQQASAWIIHREMDSFTEEMQAEMETWLNKDLRNRVAYLRIREAWRRMDCLRSVQPLDGNVDPELLQDSSVPFVPANIRSIVKRPSRIAVSAALLLTLCLGLGVLVRWAPSPSLRISHTTDLGSNQGFTLPNIVGPTNPPSGDPTSTGSSTTGLGEYRCERLPDESQACLNTSSVIRYTFNRRTRNIELVSGEASFVVRKDKSRPFNVLSGGALIQDLSASFDVYKVGHSTRVTVMEGRIRIIAPISSESRRKFGLAEVESAQEAATELRRLQQVEVDEATGALHVLPALTEDGLSRLMAWREGQIDLDGMTLGEALAEFSRYQPIAKFRYSDESLREIRVGGYIECTHLDDFLVALEHEFHVQHSMTGTDGDAVVTLSRQRDGIIGNQPTEK